SIHLLKTFIEAGSLDGVPLCGTPGASAAAREALAAGYVGATCGKVTSTGVMWQTIIHTIFILSALGIAWAAKALTGSSSKREQVAHGARGTWYRGRSKPAHGGSNDPGARDGARDTTCSNPAGASNRTAVGSDRAAAGARARAARALG